MLGKFIGTKQRSDVFCLSRKFEAKKGEKAVLVATALGVYEAEINGRKVGDAFMTPGWTSYAHILQYQTYDVSRLIEDGENEITFTVAGGWYRSGLVGDNRVIYGDKTAVAATLTVGGREIKTDETWSARESFIRSSGIYDGETWDLTAPQSPLDCEKVEFDESKLTAQQCELVKNIEKLKVKQKLLTPAGEQVFDFGQNLTGVVELKVPVAFSGTLTLRFAEILVGGNLYTANLRSAKATDTFTVRGGETITPKFTFHGFRYVAVEGADISENALTAVVRHTALKRTGKIETDNARVNRFLTNVVWSQRDNYLDVPTDCPQRDERLGWTGDANAFCMTAAYNFDVRKFFKKWLRDMRADQAPDGKIPHIVPDVFSAEGKHINWESLNSKHTDCMWCDAMVMVPYKLYSFYGDKSFLSDNYEAMCKYLGALENSTVDGLCAVGHQYGDWLALDNPPYVYNGPRGYTEHKYLASAFYAHCLDVTAKAAKVLGKSADAKKFAARRKELIRTIRNEYFTPNGKLAVETITAHVIALAFDLAEEKFRARIARTLNDEVVRRKHHPTTGFIGTAYLLFALADNGYTETAHKVLTVDGIPGWLYEVDQGATTIWERWDSLLPDGTPNPDGMNSYNHYAFGAAMEFYYRRIAGIDFSAPGFKKIRLCPAPHPELNRVNASLISPRGLIESSYVRENGEIKYEFTVPKGASAEIILPGEEPISVTAGKYAFSRKA